LLVARALRLGAYDVLEAVNGDQVLDIFMSERPDVIILDVIMPGPDGFEVCREIRANPHACATPIIMISANASEAAARATGADTFLTKPFLPSALLAAVDGLIRTRPVEAADR